MSAAFAIDDGRRRRLGVALILASAMAWSFGGVFAKLLTIDAWTAAFGRALAAAAFLVIVLAVQKGQRLLPVLVVSARATPLSIVIGAVSMVLLVGAFFRTTVANVTVIYATAPFIAAGLLWLMARTVPDRRTILASTVALVGVVIVVGGGFSPDRFIGDILALGMTVTFLIAAIALRNAPAADATAVSLLTCLVCAAMVAPMAAPATIDGPNLVFVALFGIMTSGIAYLCFMAGARLISTTEAGLLSVAEVPLAPFWSFVILAEVPPLATFIGGTVIVGIVLWYLSGDSSARRAG